MSGCGDGMSVKLCAQKEDLIILWVQNNVFAWKGQGIKKLRNLKTLTCYMACW